MTGFSGFCSAVQPDGGFHRRQRRKTNTLNIFNNVLKNKSHCCDFGGMKTAETDDIRSVIAQKLDPVLASLSSKINQAV